MRIRFYNVGATVLIVVLISAVIWAVYGIRADLTVSEYSAVEVNAVGETHAAGAKSEPPEHLELEYLELADRRAFEPFERVAKLTFPSGREVTVQLRQFDWIYPPFKPSAKFSESYDALVEAANNGDIPSARYIGDRLRHCQNAFSDRASLDNAISVLKDKRIVTYPPGSWREDEVLSSSADLTPLIAGLERRFGACEGISNDQKRNASLWSSRAAAEGDYFATRDLISADRNSKRSLELWQELLDAGYSMPFQEMAAYFFRQSNSTDGRPDYFQSYAHLFAHSKLKETSFAYKNGFDKVYDHEGLIALGDLLSAQERMQAEELAADMIENNPNCCIVWRLEKTE